MSRAPDRVDAFVGARVAQRRAAMGLTQQGLAGRLGISSQQIQKYEAGANRVSVSRLHQIAMVLGAPAATFFPPFAARARDMPPEDTDGLTQMRFMSANPEGRAVAAAFPLIESRETRRAVATLVEALVSR